MPDPVKGEPVVTPPAFEIREGRVFIDGIDVTTVARPGEDPNAIESETPPSANAGNAALEGEEVTDPDAKEKPVEAVPETKVPEKEPGKEPKTPPEPKEAAEAAKLKFKLKFRGKEEEVEYEPTQIQTRLNKLRAFEENEKEFWEKGKEVEPYREIVKSEWFKAKLKEAYESGELAAPEAPEAPPATVQYEIMKRKADPDHDAVMESLRDYARNLPLDAVKILDSDANVFLAEYDRVAKDVREKKAAPIVPVAPVVDPADLKKKLAFKESAKSRAEVVQPGTMTEPQSKEVALQKRIRVLEKAMRDPQYANRNIEFAAEIIMLRQQRQPTERQ